MRPPFSSKRKHEGEPKQTLLPRDAKAGSSSVSLLALLSLIVVGATLFAHWPVLSAQAKSFDDEEAIIQNHLVQHPSWNSVGRFFGEVTLSSVVRGYYRPLTLTSLMLDWAMGGRPEDFRAFHRTSLALHVGSTVLVILLCYQVFRQPLIAALVGLLFGVHPLTVEPIAWVMERKTVLAAFFAFAYLNVYVRYTRGLRPGWLVAAVVLYLLSLLAKPTGTPLPIIMLLMDYWPLKRFSRRAVLEKVPFFILSAVFAALCVLCEQKVNSLSLPVRLAPLHLPLRLCWLTTFYPCKILLPIHLSLVYALPDPLDLSNGVVLLAVAGTIALIGFLIVSRRWTPALWVGAAMFYVGLAPTMGFVRYSWVVASDKYVYLPAVGLLFILGRLLERAWSAGTDNRPGVRRVGMVAAVLTVACLLVAVTRRQVSHWQTTGGLYDYAVALAPKEPRLYNNRGNAYDAIGQHVLAIRDYNKTIELKPDDAETYYNRGIAYGGMGDSARAIQDYTRAIELKPHYAEAYFNRGIAYGGMGDYARAIQDYNRAIELKPDSAEAYNNRGNACKGLGDFAGAIRDYTQAIELKPDFAGAYNNRGIVYRDLRDYQRAIRDYTRAIELQPDYAAAYNNRGIAYGGLGDSAQAIRDYNRAIELKPDYGEAYYNRGIAYRGLGDSAQAIRDQTRAIELKPDDAEAYNNRGNAYRKVGHHDLAIQDYTKAIELKPDYAEAHSNRGNAYLDIGRHDLAIRDYTRAIELKPDYAVLYSNRGAAYYLLKQYEKAWADVKMCKQLGGTPSADFMKDLIKATGRTE